LTKSFGFLSSPYLAKKLARFADPATIRAYAIPGSQWLSSDIGMRAAVEERTVSPFLAGHFCEHRFWFLK